jgi:hypothetical protein
MNHSRRISKHESSCALPLSLACLGSSWSRYSAHTARAGQPSPAVLARYYRPQRWHLSGFPARVRSLAPPRRRLHSLLICIICLQIKTYMKYRWLLQTKLPTNERLRLKNYRTPPKSTPSSAVASLYNQPRTNPSAPASSHSALPNQPTNQPINQINYNVKDAGRCFPI